VYPSYIYNGKCHNKVVGVTYIMPQVISYIALRNMVQEGHIIKWCGTTTSKDLVVHLAKDGINSVVSVDVESELNISATYDVVRNGEARRPLSTVSPVPPNTDFFAILRKASVLGINIAGDCTKGSAKRYTPLSGCVCGYDLELDLRDHDKKGFPLPSVAILSAALWCTCGYKYFVTTSTDTTYGCENVCTSTELVSRVILEISVHKPLWLTGWNCYSFDNTCLAFHATDSNLHLFRQVKVGAAGSVDYGYILNIEGVYNVDTYAYMARTQKHLYTDLSLYGVASKLGTTSKTDMPDLYSDISIEEVMKYNMNDSAVAAELWTATKAHIEVPSLALCSCAPLYDCIRYMTGAMAACTLSSEALLESKIIDWSRCDDPIRYDGGKVLEPIRGVHRNVVVCDYSSMYPTIMIDARISPETVVVSPNNERRPYGDVWWSHDAIYVALENNVASFPRHGQNIQRRILQNMIDTRNDNRKVNPNYASALKVSANSAYGAMGYQNSPMFSPSCSSSVTAIGRWCLDLACKTFDDGGMKVVYGDTDSCFAVPTYTTDLMYNGDAKAHAMRCLDLLHRRLSETPFAGMRMSLENIHPCMIILEKKKYCKTTSRGNLEYKGMSIVRKDTLGICKDACATICRILTSTKEKQTCIDMIARYINDVSARALSRSLTASDVSRVVKKDGRYCYVYTRINGQINHVPVDGSLSQDVEDYDVAYVMSTLNAEILRILSACGFGSMQDLMDKSTVLF